MDIVLPNRMNSKPIEKESKSSENYSVSQKKLMLDNKSVNSEVLNCFDILSHVDLRLISVPCEVSEESTKTYGTDIFRTVNAEEENSLGWSKLTKFLSTVDNERKGNLCFNFFLYTNFLIK